MNKRTIALSLTTLALFGTGHLLKKYDPYTYYLLSSKLQIINDSMRNVHQHIRKRELYKSANGETLELNAGAGLTLPLLPESVARYYANESNPALCPYIRSKTTEYAVPVSQIEPATSLEILKALSSETMDTVILNGALRYETPQATKIIFAEIYRVLRPGGYLLFSEDIYHNSHQIAPFQEIRRVIRNLITNESQTNFVPDLLQHFEAAYIEDWSSPPLGFKGTHRDDVKVLLDFHQRHSAEENLQEYYRLLPKYNFSILHRPTVGGWAVKKTTAKGHEQVLKGQVSLDMVRDFSAVLEPSKHNNIQAKRDEKAKLDGYQFESKLAKNLQQQMDRAIKKRPTEPKDGYKELQSIPITFASLFGV